MTGNMWGWVGGGIIALLAAIWSALLSRSATTARAKLDEVSAYSTLVGDLQKQVANIRTDVTLAQSANETLRVGNDVLRTQISGLQYQITVLQQTVHSLTALLTKHQIPLPPPTGALMQTQEDL